MRLAATAIALIAIACAGADEQWRQDSTVLACSPQALVPGQVLTLTLGPNHGNEIAIRRLRDQKQFLLVVGSSPPGHFQLMTPTEFAAAGSVEIGTDTVATAWALDAKPEVVFSEPGEYEIAVSPNLESEVGGYFCRITFKSS
jgi:hypothetical protein